MSPTIFNMVVDALLKAALMGVCGPQVAQHSLVWVAGEQEIISYADDGSIAGRNPIWFYETLTTLVTMFDWVGLDTNMVNTKYMTFTPSFIWGEMGKDA